MNRLLKAAAISVMVLICAGQAGATTSTVVTTNPANASNPAVVPGFSYALGALAQNAIDTTIVNVRGLIRPFIGASGVPATIITTSYGSSVAGDSLNVSVDVGVTASGPWFTAVSFANAYSHTASLAVRSNIPAHSVLPITPFWRLRVKSKGTAALTAANRFYVQFPVVSTVPPK